MMKRSIRLALGAALGATAAMPAASGSVPVSGAGTLTVNPTPIAAPPAPLAAPGAPPVRAASTGPLSGGLPNDIASPLTTGVNGACCPCRTVHRVVHQHVVHHVVRPALVAVAYPPPLVPLYPVVAYRPVYVARPVFAYRAPVVFYGRPFLRAPFYGPRRVWRPYDRPGW